MKRLDANSINDKIKAKACFCLFFESIPSTNTYLKELAKNSDMPTGTVVISTTQTSGRGRLGRVFVSPKNRGLYLSYLIRVEKLSDFIDFAPFSALIPYRVLKKMNVDGVSIKWPNDILINGKKLCGILVEGESLSNSIILGIGINVSTRKIDFPFDLQDKATSLSLSGVEIKDMNEFATAIVFGIAEYFEQFKRNKEELYNEYSASLSYDGKTISVFRNDKWIKGEFLRIEKDGSLILGLDNGNEYAVKYGDILE